MSILSARRLRGRGSRCDHGCDAKCSLFMCDGPTITRTRTSGAGAPDKGCSDRVGDRRLTCREASQAIPRRSAIVTSATDEVPS